MEAANHVIGYLSCLSGHQPRHWLRLLLWAEFCFNSAYQSSLRTTPFHVVYGQQLPILRSYDRGSARVPAIDQALVDHNEFLSLTSANVFSQLRTTPSSTDDKHRDVAFGVGDWVWVRLLQW